MTTSVNGAISNGESIFQQLVWSPMVAAAKAAYPVLNVWPISAFVDLIANYLFSSVRLFVDVTAIKLLNDEHQAAYNTASVQLEVIAHEKGIDSPEFQTARATALAAMSKFTNIAQ